MKASVLAEALAVLVILGFSMQSAWADEGYGHAGQQGMGPGMGGHRESTGHYLRHLVRHQKEIGLTAEQVAKLKAIQLDLDRTRIRTEAEVLVADRELAALVEEEKADLSSIEAKVKQSETLEGSLRMAAIKARRDALARIIHGGSSRNRGVTLRDGRVEARRTEAYLKQYVEGLSGEPARLHAVGAACRLVAAVNRRLEQKRS